MFIATGKPAICVGYVSTLTDNAVCVPPKPPGPIPNLFILVKSSSSNSFTYGISELLSAGLAKAFFASIAHFSNVPPIQTPTTIGGHALAPAFFTAVNTASFTPSIPSAGFNINTLLIFSLPNPFGATVIFIFSPGTIL